MLRKLLKLIGFLLLIAFIVITLAFSSRESRSVACRDIQVVFNENDPIQISETEINRLVTGGGDQLMGRELRRINADSIENEVEKHRAILKAEVYKVIAKDSSSYKGILGVRVSHRKPVVRIMSPNGNYYLDREGEQIPISSGYTANVLVVTGNFSENYAKEELLPFVLFLEENPFWEAQVEQVHVEQNGDVVLTPLVGDHLIEMGPLENYSGKLKNMRAFYQQVLSRNNWDKYGTISVKYKNQVIAKKR